MSLAESGFDPLARTCQFMLTEEAHHMFIGHTGLARITKRTLEVMAELKTEDPEAVRRAGAIDLPTIQKYINYWFSSALDLFGSESSSNAALYFAAGLKGRPNEAQYEDHLALGQTYALDAPDGVGGVAREEIPLRNAMNEATRTAYVAECQIFLDRWNDIIQQAGFAFRYRLPSPRFRRSIGLWAGVPTDLDGRPIAAEAFEARRGDWLPTEADRAFVHSLMRPVTEPGKMAAWIAPPERGINSQAVDYEYVRLA
jgi:benzoyl-CoA 2,3-dioxygenase component B